MEIFGWIVVFAVPGLILLRQIEKGVKMMKYKKLYEEALRNKNKSEALRYGRLYHQNRTNGKSKNLTAAELIITNDMKAAGIE